MRNAIPILGLLLLVALPPVGATPTTGRACSIANDDVVRIASWDLDGVFGKTASGPDALSDMAAMIRMLDADIVALQGVTVAAKEVSGSLSRLREGGRCYRALASPGGFATLFDPQALELLYAEGSVVDCDGKSITSPALHGPVADRAGQLSYLRVKSTDPPPEGAFDFVLLNADAKALPEDLAGLAARYDRLDADYPWLAAEKDRIVLGDLAVDGARLTNQYFPQTKPLINLLLKINLGLSDKTFDQAVAAARSSTSEGDRYNDNILVRRWDQPGTCTGSTGYCGGLEEFINARVYGTTRAGGRALGAIGSAVHPPVAARFCRFADSDPSVNAR